MEYFLKIGKYYFAIKKATFRYAPKNDDIEYDGWWFDIGTFVNESLTTRHGFYGLQPHLSSEHDPVPLENKADLTDTELYLKEGWCREWNEPYFNFYLFEHGDIFDTRLKFLEKQGDCYLIDLKAKIPAGDASKNVTKLHIHTWIKQLLPN